MESCYTKLHINSVSLHTFTTSQQHNSVTKHLTWLLLIGFLYRMQKVFPTSLFSYLTLQQHRYKSESYALRLPSPFWPPTEITSLEVSDCIFKLHLIDWPFVPLAWVWCFAATLAPPPSSGPHLHQSTRLAACTLTHSCYKLCELVILWVLSVWLNVHIVTLFSSNLQLVSESCDMFIPSSKKKVVVLEYT